MAQRLPATGSPFQTWGRTYKATPLEWVHPADEAEVIAAVRRVAQAGGRLRVVGGGHSWSDAAITQGTQLRLGAMNRLLSASDGVATAQAGMRLRDFNDALADAGLALPIVGSIDRQHLAGVLATGTHGSSLVHGNLSSLVCGMRLVTATGEPLQLGNDDPRLPAARVGLGALGVVTEVSLRVQPAFRIAETTERVSFERGVAALPTLGREAEWAKFWWLPHTDAALLFRGERTTAAPTWSAASRAFDEHVLHPRVFGGVVALGSAMRASVPTLNRLVAALHFRPRRVVGRSDLVLSMAMPPLHRESEWAIPVEHGAAFVSRLREGIERLKLRVNFIVEARYVRGDDAWLSPAYGRDSLQVGLYIGDSADVSAYYALGSELAAEYGGRPHWGKEADFDPARVAAVFPKAAAFRELAAALDPNGVFRNDFLDRVLGPLAP